MAFILSIKDYTQAPEQLRPFFKHFLEKLGDDVLSSIFLEYRNEVHRQRLSMRITVYWAHSHKKIHFCVSLPEIYEYPDNIATIAAYLIKDKINEVREILTKQLEEKESDEKRRTDKALLMWEKDDFREG